MAAPPPTKREHLLGVTLAITVSFIWVGSSELIQHIFGAGGGFKKPYMFTYLTTSMFSVLLIGFLRRSWRTAIHAPSGKLSQQYASMHTGAERATPYNVRDVAGVAALVAPLYFLANYVFNSGLGMTTVSSSSTISQLSSLFTLAIGACTGVESFSWMKLGASIITISGAAIISGIDGRRGQFLGDALSLLAAFLFGVYITVLKANAPRAGVMDMGMMWGFVGLFNLCFLWVPLPLLSFFGVEPFALPSRHTCVLLAANALVGSVLSDFLWAKSVVLTSALVGTIALSLTVPLSLVYDAAFKGMNITPLYVLGVVLVVSGFVVVNLELAIESRNKADDNDADGDEEVVLSMSPNQADEDDEVLEF